MKISDVRKRETKILVAGRIPVETKRFIDEHKINVGLLIEVSIKKLKKESD